MSPEHHVAAIDEALPGVGEGWIGECSCGRSFQSWTRHDAETRLRGHIAVQEARQSLEDKEAEIEQRVRRAEEKDGS